MSAVFTGNGLGMFDTSLTQLGSALGDNARLGQGRERQLVNVATGNLLLQGQDEFLNFRGLGVDFNRTYNSRGLSSEVGADGWVTGFERRVALLSGTANTPGSVMRRYTGDGGFQDFTYFSYSIYHATGGEGAHDSLTYNNATWTYVEGSTQREEQYADHLNATWQGRLLQIRDLKSDATTPTTWDVLYVNNRISEIRSSNGGSTGDALLFGYDASGRLASVSTRENATVRGQVSYGYDSMGRLTSVTRDLTPDNAGDNTWNGAAPVGNNARLYRTEYTYVGSTLRMASLKQSDGTLVSYTYASDGRISTVTSGDSNTNDADGRGETLTYTYNYLSTTVSDSLNRSWTYTYDAAGQLTRVTAPAVAGQSDITTYQYDAAGNVIQAKTMRGGTTLSLLDYQYDNNGNIVAQWDALGNAVTRTYSATNQVLTETRYTDVDADRTGPNTPAGGMITIYVYDTRNRLRFVINAAREVTEFTYATSGNGIGQQATVRRYVGSAYPGSGSTLSETMVTNWTTAAQKAQSTLSEFSYDLWGRLAQRTDYASVNANGDGVLDAATDLTRYTYDAQGLLRQQVTVRGAGRTPAGAAANASAVTDYSYDGMGRLLGVLSRDYGTASNNDASSIQTSYAYIDSAYQIAVTSDAGAIRTETRNAAGRVVAVSDAAMVAGAPATRTAQYVYDSAGQLRISEDAGGGRSYFFYDAKGRLEGTVDATGAVVRNTYDGADRVLVVQAYANRVTTTGWTSLAALPAGVAAIGVIANAAQDRVTTMTYDGAGRLATKSDAVAASLDRSVSTYSYDGAGRLLQSMQGDREGFTATVVRVARYFYDNADRQVALLDAEGYLTETIYDKAGRALTQTRYATQVAAALRASGTLAQMRPAADAANDQVTRHYYDGRGQRVGTLDAQGYLSEWVIDEAGNTRAERRYAQAVSWIANDTLSTLRNRAGGCLESRMAYNGLGQLVTRTDPEGTVTRYNYDEAGRLVKTEAAQGTTEVRENNRRYNMFGELIGELAGEGSVHLLGGMGEAQLDAVYAQYGVRHSYDALGRRIESIDAGGNKTWYFYDSVGRLTFTVRGVADGGNVPNAQGEVTETRYTAFGDASDTLAYTGRIAIAVPGDRTSVAGAISTLAYVAATDRRHQFTYTVRGQLASALDAEGALTQYSYDAFGRLSRQISAVGSSAASTTEFLYDKRDLLTQTTRGVGSTVQRSNAQTFDAFGRLIGSVDGNGNVASFGYDRLGRQLSTTQVVQGRTETTASSYDAFDRIVSVTDALGRQTLYAYDETARTLAVTTPEGVRVTTAHNRHGQTVTVTDNRGQVVATNTYNRDGQLTAVADALNHASSNAYDSRGLLVATVDASGRSVELRYDAAGRVLQRIEDPGTGKLNLTTAYAYDAQGRRLTVTDPTGRICAYTYDREGRLLQTALDPAGRNQRVTYAYDAQGRQVTMVEGAASPSAKTTQYAYDALGRRTSETVDPAGLNLVTGYAYDRNDNVIRRTDASGAVTRYYYDQANRLACSVDPLGAITRNWYDGNGRLVAVRSFTQATVAATLTDATSIAEIDARLAWNAGDQGEYRVYDRDGRLRWVLNLNGETRELLYDSASRFVGTRSYAARFTPDTALRAKLLAGTALPGEIVIARNDALDQASYRVLDQAGRLFCTIDALGNVQANDYDDANRVVGTRRFATAVVLDAAFRSRLESGTSLPSDVSRIVFDDAHDLRSYQVFNAAGQLRYSIDALGGVQAFSLDAAGRTVATRRFAQAISLDATLLDQLQRGTILPVDIANRIAVNDALDLSAFRVFDASGQLRFVIDGSGNVQETRYSAAGQAVYQLAYAEPVAAATLAANLAALRAGTVSVATVTSWVSAQEAGARMTTSVRDAAGRVRYLLTRDTATTCTVSELRYDACGRIVAQVAYAISVPTTLDGTVTGVAAAVTAAGGDAAARQRLTRMVYDADGQLRFRIDDAGGVTEQRYDGLGQGVETRQYGQSIPLATAATEAAVAAAVATQSGANVRITTTAYDSAGRVRTVTDAAGKSESYGYDALGNRTSYTNKLGHVWTYAYDAAGRLASETSPVVNLATADNAGVVTMAARAVVTQIAYDALGNVVQRSEDATGPRPRITRYEYDNRGHQIKTIFPDAGAIDAATGAINATGVNPTIEVGYNALGQAVVQKDVRGNYSYKAYDTLGRLAYEVDQEGYVTGYAYNAFGEQASLRRYAAALNFAAIGGWSSGAALTLPQFTAAALVANAGQDRVLSTHYDRLGRQAEIQQSAVSYLKADGSAAVGSPTTRFTYTLYGELARTSLLLDAAGDLWAHTYQYYDDLGHNTLTVDAEGYVTGRAYNAVGELIQNTEYARALDSAAMAALTIATAPAPAAAGDAATGYDRITRWEYDALGRKATETVTHRYQRTDGSAGVRDVQTAYTYDAAGRATAVTGDAGTANATTTVTEYDALDHVVGVREPVRATLAAGAESALLATTANTLGSSALYEQVSPYSSMVYDGFGNLVAVRRHANGWLAGAATPGAADNARDQAQVMRYDWQGRAVWEKDGENAIVTRSYDAADNLLASTYRLAGSGTTWATVASSAGYDRVGRQISGQVVRERYDGATALGQVTDSSESVAYNAFGEITGKGHVAGDRPLVYVYDQAGRLISDNQSGAIRSYGYNLAGHQVRESHVASVATGTVTAVTVSITDRLGRTVQMRLPSNTADAAQVNSLAQRVDRWGNVLQVLDPRGYQTDYQYNDRNQLVRETRPLVKVVKDTVEGTWARPEQFWFYDALGRLIGNRDANGNTTLYEYDAAGQQVRMIDANGSATLTAYDAFGLARFAQNPLGYITFKQYDRLGRVTRHGDYLNAAAGPAREKKTLESYLLNRNGDRLQVTNALGKAARYDYDSRSLLLRSQSAMGVVMEYGYDLGGRKALETYNLAHTTLVDRDGESVRDNEQTWNYDYFGRLIDRNDLSGRDYNFSYDPASGQLVTESNSSGLARTTVYYANGQVREIQEPGGIVYRYEYDAAGNRTVEETTTRDSRGKDVRVRTAIAYDSHNRLRRIDQDDLIAAKRVFELTYDYDAAGNRSRVVAQTAYGPDSAPIGTANQPPVVIGQPPDRVIRSGIASEFRVRLSDLFRDPEGEPLQVTAIALSGATEVALPAWLGTTVDLNTGEMVFTASTGSSVANNQDFVIRLKAVEVGASPGSPNAMVSFTVRVRSNSAPVDAAGAQTVFNIKSGKPWAQELPVASYFTDADVGDVLRIGVAAVSPDASAWLSVDTANPAVVRLGIKPGATAQNGTYTVTLVGTDLAGLTKTRTITLVVSTNAAPTVVAPLPNQEATLGRSYAFTRDLAAVFNDSQGDPLAVQATRADGTPLPAWLSFQYLPDQAVPQLRFSGQVPTDLPSGTVYQIKLTATDPDGLSATVSFSLTLTGNRAPVVLAPLPTQTLRVNDTYSLQIPIASLFADPEGDALTFELEHPSGASSAWLQMSVDAVAGTITLSGKPLYNQSGNYAVLLKARDSAGLASAATLNFQVRGDTPPQVNNAVVLPNASARISRPFSITLPDNLFFDADGDALSLILKAAVYHPEVPSPGMGEPGEPAYWEYVDLPAWIAFDPATRTFSGTVPAGETVRSMPLGVYAYDGHYYGNARRFDFSLTANVNSAPTYTAGSLPNRGLVQGGAVDFALPAGAFTDADGDAIAYSAQVLVGSAWVGLGQLGLTIDAATGRITGTAANLAQTSYSARIVASDGSAQATGSFSFSVNNTAPVAVAIPAQTAARNVAWSFSVAPYFSDPEQNPLTYSASGLPAGLSINAGTGLISGTATAATGNYTVTITADDGRGGSVAASFSLTLANAAPQAPSLPNQAAMGSVPWSYVVPAFTDPNGDVLGYTVSGLPAWMSFNAATRTLSGIPGPVGAWTITVTATDPGGASASRSFVVSTPNSWPMVINAIPAQTAGRNQAWSYQIPANTFADPNGDSLGYSASGLPAGISFNAATRTFSGTATVLGSSTVSVTASDGRGGSSVASFTLTVANLPPTYAGGLVNRSVLRGSAVNWPLPAGAFTDPNGDVLGYTLLVERPGYWEAYTGPSNEPLERWIDPVWLAASAAGLSVNASTGTITGNAWELTLANAAGYERDKPFNYRVKLVASDGTASAEGLFTLHIGVPPTAPTIPAQSARQNVAWSYQAPIFTDPNSEGVTYTASGLPPGIGFTAATRTFSGTPSVYGAYTLTVTAHYGGGGTLSSSFTLTVAQNLAPVAPTVPNQTLAVGAPWGYQLPPFTDANNDVLTYSATGLPPGLSLAGITLSGTATTAGVYTVTYTANDSRGGIASTTFTLTVTAAPTGNQAPVVQNPIPQQSELWNRNWSFTVPANTFYDANGDTLTYSASSMPAGMSFNPATRTFSMYTPKGTQGFTYSGIRVTVNDGRGGTASTTFTLYVEAWEGGAAGPQAFVAAPATSTSTSTSTAPAGRTTSPSTTTSPTTSPAAAGPAQAAAAPIVRSTESWYAYDQLNRLVVNNGQLVNGQVVLKQGGGDSWGLAYDAAGHQSVQYRYAYSNGQWVLMASQQTYSPRGERLLAYSEGSSTQVGEQCTYDDAGRLLTRRTWFPPGLRMDWIDQEGTLTHVFVGGLLSGETSYTYDDDGRLLTQTSRSRSDQQVQRYPTGYPANPARMLYAWVGEVFDGVPGTADDPLIALRGVNTVDYTGRYDSAGRVTGYTVQNTDTAASYTHTYTLAYTGWDDYREASISGSSDNSAYKATTTTLTYDAAGRQTELRDHTDALDDRVRSLALDGDGHVLARRDGTLHNGVFTQSGSTPEALGRQTLHVVYASGQQLATLDEAGRLDAISRLTAFNNSGTGDRQVVVQAGESLRSLAQRLYGTEALWYVLAEANGLDEGDALIPGTSLTAPEVTTVSNDANTFKPYDPSEITGPTAPALPYIAAPDKGCSTLAMIIIIVVIIVVTVMTAGAAAGAMGVTGTTATGAAASTTAVGGSVLAGGSAAGVTLGATAGSFAAANMGVAMAASAFAGGVAGSIAGQAVGSLMGASSFSWRNALVAGVTTMATAGVGGLTSAWSPVARGAVSAAVGNASSYAANKALGNETSFSWRSIAASAVSAAISAKVGEMAGLKPSGGMPGGAGDIARDVGNGMLQGITNLHVRRAFGFNDPIDYGNIAADAFGNALGNAAVRGVGDATPNVGTVDGAATDWGAFTPNVGSMAGANDLGTGSFLNRYPDATASLFNGDSGRSNAINVTTGNALLFGERIPTLDTVRVTAVRDPYARGGWYFYGWNRSAQEWVDVQRQSLDPVAWSRPPSGIGSAIADFSRQLQADMNAQPQPLWQQSTAQRVGLQVSPLMDKFADRNPVTGEPLTQGPAMRALDADAKPATLEAWSSLKQAEQRQGRQQLDQVAGDMLAFAMPRYDNGTVNGQLINPLTNQRLSASAQQAAMMNWVGLATLRLGGGGGDARGGCKRSSKRGSESLV